MNQHAWTYETLMQALRRDKSRGSLKDDLAVVLSDHGVTTVGCLLSCLEEAVIDWANDRENENND